MTTKHELAAKIDALVLHMQQVATEIDYYGGMAEWAQHGAELMSASAYAQTWADGIRTEAEAETTQPPAPEYCFAQYEEGPYQSCEGDVACDLAADYSAGDTVTIHRGIKITKQHRDFIAFDADEIIEAMGEAAFEECGEVADDYLPPLPPDQAKALEDHMKAACVSWFNQNIPQPKFWLVDQIEEMELTL